MPSRTTIRYVRTFPFPVADAYAWLTDYQDDDPKRAGAIVKERPVVERTTDRVVMQGRIETMGRAWTGRVEVALLPPDQWRATLFDAKGRPGHVYEYRLESVDGGRASRLTVHYNFVMWRWKTRLLFVLGRAKMRRELDRMWDGFARSMQAELAPPVRAAR